MVEPEWDDATRFRVMGLDRHDADCCPGCGMHKSVTDDMEHHHMTFDERVCEVCASQDRYGRVVADRDDEALKLLGEKPQPRVSRPDDGRHIFMRRMTPEEVAARTVPPKPRRQPKK